MNAFLQNLAEITGPKGFLGGEELNSRAASNLDNTKHQAIALLRPETTQQVSNILKHCNEAGQPVVIQGGGSGLVEGGIASNTEIAISLERMKGIENIDVIGRTMTVNAGTQIQIIQEAAEANGLIFAVDWGARGSAQIGGAVATNAGGNSVLKYGMIRDQILGLEVVLADGTILSSMNRLLKNNTGYDLKQLFIGSEGTLGVVTRAVLRLHSKPKNMHTAFLALDKYEDVLDLLALLQRELAGKLSAFEVMWQMHYEMIVDQGPHQNILPKGYGFYVVVEASDYEENSEHFENVMAKSLEDIAVVDAVLCSTVAQRDAVWAIREDVDTFFRVLDPPIPFDVSLPVADMNIYASKVLSEMETKFPQMRGTVFGHLGDNNLHFCFTTGNNHADDKAAVSKIVYENLVPFQGSISAEHGIGVSKLPYLHYSRTHSEIEWMKRLKTAFDPKNILNPGRVVKS